MPAADMDLSERPDVEKTPGDHLPVPSSESPDSGRPGPFVRLIRFVAGLAGIFVFLFGVLPAVQCWGPVRDVHKAIERSGIDATALFYSETPVSSEAESSIRNALKYPARGGDD